ncbi:MAG: hypothetical protein QM709_09730 [Spongiibacteraceae bacterium]
MNHLLRFFLLIILALCESTVAFAQDANSQKALQKAQFMLRQATAEKAELQTQVADLKQQVDKLTRELESTKSGAVSAQQRNEQKFTTSMAEWKQHSSAMSDELRATKEQLKEQSTQRKLLEEKLQDESKSFTACYANNQKLYEINRQLLTRYADKGIVDVIKQREPFTGVAQVEIENMAQDYQYQLDDLKIKAEPQKSD